MMHPTVRGRPARSSDCTFEVHSPGPSAGGGEFQFERPSPPLMAQSREVAPEHVNQNVVQGPRLAAPASPNAKSVEVKQSGLKIFHQRRADRKTAVTDIQHMAHGKNRKLVAA